MLQIVKATLAVKPHPSEHWMDVYGHFKNHSVLKSPGSIRLQSEQDIQTRDDRHMQTRQCIAPHTEWHVSLSIPLCVCYHARADLLNQQCIKKVNAAETDNLHTSSKPLLV